MTALYKFLSDHCWFCRRKPVPGPNGMAVVCKRHKNRKVMVDATFSVAPYVIKANVSQMKAWPVGGSCPKGFGNEVQTKAHESKQV